MPTLRLVSTPTRRPIIELRINGVNYRFLIDTGASVTLVDPALLPDLSKQQESSRYTRKCIAVNGSVHIETIAIVFRLAGVSISEISIHSSAGEKIDGTSGIIGQDILQQFKSVTFDNVRHVVRFEV